MAGLVVMSSLSLKQITPCQERVAGSIQGLPSLARSSTSHRVSANQIKKIKIDTIVGTDGGMNLKDGIDASGRKPTGKGGYHYSDKYGGNIDGYSTKKLSSEKDYWNRNGRISSDDYFEFQTKTPCQERMSDFIQGLPSIARSSAIFSASADQIKKIKTDTLYGLVDLKSRIKPEVLNSSEIPTSLLLALDYMKAH